MKVECIIERLPGTDDRCMLTFMKVEGDVVRKVGFVAKFGEPMPVKFDIEWSFGNAQ